MKIAVGTKNKAKVGAVEAIVLQYFPDAIIESIDVASDVSVQPFSNEETRQGAINRARNTFSQTNADLSFGLEGGVDEIDDTMYCCNWGAVMLKDGTVFSSSGAQFALPEVIAEQLRVGKELGPVMDIYTNTENIRHNQGAIGIFSAGLIDRKEMFEHIVKLLVGQVLFKLNRETK
jgi:inosine/xanthosine triphosphatase